MKNRRIHKKNSMLDKLCVQMQYVCEVSNVGSLQVKCLALTYIEIKVN